jgi:hypothetical protein
MKAKHCQEKSDIPHPSLILHTQKYTLQQTVSSKSSNLSSVYLLSPTSRSLTAYTKMGSIQTETIVDQPNSKAAGLKLYALQGSYGDFRDDLARDGYAVVKGAIPKDRADSYASTMFSYLEDFGLGFDRNDLSTATEEHLPIINEKGMCMNYGLAHEKFMWDIRTEAGVREVFEKVYGTEDLLVSFDAANFTFPNRTDIPSNKPWPHQDQDPEKPGFRCLQGLVNLLPNGLNDGGLIVCKGGHLLSEEFHNAFRGKETRIHQWCVSSVHVYIKPS